MPMLLRLVRKIETFFGVACAFLISLLVIVAFFLALMDHKVPPSSGKWAAIEGGASLVLIVLDAGFVCVVSDNLRHGWTPFALEFALRHRRMPLVVRPFACAWGAAHFLLGAAVAFMIEAALASLPTVTGSALYIAAFFVIGFTLANGFNLYAMFALAASGAGEPVIRMAWKWRAALDVLIAIAAEVCAIKYHILDF